MAVGGLLVPWVAGLVTTADLSPLLSPERRHAAAIDAIIDQLQNPTRDPALGAKGQLAAGSWHVVHAPHIDRLSSLLGAHFDITYSFDAGDRIRSSVKYTGKLLGEGFLSAEGVWFPLDGDTVRVVWSDMWWNPGAPCPSPSSSDGALSGLVRTLGRAGMIKDLSTFPVEYLDEDLCVFLFKLTESRIAAVKQTGRLAAGGAERRVARGL